MSAVLLTICITALSRIYMQKNRRKPLDTVIILTACLSVMGIGFIATSSTSTLFLDITQTPLYIVIITLCSAMTALLGVFYLKKYPLLMRDIYVRIPFVTVLTEEIIFRGVLLGLLMQIFPTPWAIGIGSILFGLWHIYEPSNAYLLPKQKNRRRLIDVISTSLAGALFCVITVATETIVASFLLHWVINSIGILFGASKRVQNNLHKIY